MFGMSLETTALIIVAISAAYYFLVVKGVRFPGQSLASKLPLVPAVNPQPGDDDTDSVLISILKKAVAVECAGNPVLLNLADKELEALDQVLKGQATPTNSPVVKAPGV